MAVVVSQRIRVPSKRSLEFLMSHWDRIREPVIDGEFTIPDRSQYTTVNPNRISHAIRNINTETYDPNTQTVVAEVVFTGPMSKSAQDEAVKGDIRFCPRCVRVRPPGGSDKDVFESIITWDLVHRPKDDDNALKNAMDKERAKMRKEANDKDKYIELMKKRIKK